MTGLALATLLAPAEPLALPLLARWLAAFVLFVALPGWLLVGVLAPAPMGKAELVLLALAAGYGLAILLGLALYALFRPVAPWQIAAGGALVVAALAAAGWRRAGVRSRSPAASRQRSAVSGRDDATVPVRAGALARLGGAWEGIAGGTWREYARAWPLALVVVVAGALRLWDLGWSELQGDEARVVLRAMAALQGETAALAAHRKVPGEIMLAYLFAGSLGQIVEGVARLPFALAGVGAMAAFFCLTRALLGTPAALVAGLLLAVNGYFVAFGRILQYDSLSFFLGIVGLLCCWKFGQQHGTAPDACPATTAPAGTWAWCSGLSLAFIGALLLASAALVALGAVFFVAPALMLAWPGLVRHRRSWWLVPAWGWPVVPGLLALVLVLRGEDGGVGGTVWSYLGPRLGGDRPYWNAPAFLRSANHYLSTPYLLASLSAGPIGVSFAVLEGARAARFRGLLLRIGCAVALAAMAWPLPGPALVLGALLVLGLAVQAPGQPLAARVGLLWAAGPLVVHLLFIRVPGTHWREAFPGLLLLLAVLAEPALAHRWARPVVGVLVGALAIGAGHYAWVTLVQRVPEYQIVYPRDRHPLDWLGQDGRGIGGVFGAAHRHGWKALGVLDGAGALLGSYTTNESPAIAAWYLRRPQGCAGAIDLLVRAPRTPQDRNLAGPVPLPTGYDTRGQLRVDGRTTISLLVPPATTTRPPSVEAERYAEQFDRELSSAWRPVGELYRADLGAASARRTCSEQIRAPG